MSKAIHLMIRVLEPSRSIRFYEKCFGFVPVRRHSFSDFTLIYLRNPESDFEIELTHNHGRSKSYTHGDGYGHIALVVDDVDSIWQKVEALSYSPTPVKDLIEGDKLLARFFFVQDPDGYKVEILARMGPYR